MKLLFDFLPIFIFFFIYKVYGIYAATAIAIVVTFLQISWLWFRHRKVEPTYIITFTLITVFGGATIFFHDAIFIKWKVSILNWALAIIFLASTYLYKKPLIEQMIGDQVELPEPVWRRLNLMWVGFFAFMGFVNLYIIYNFSTDVWVNFKLFGLLGLTVIFAVIQSIYLAKHLKK